MEVRTSHLRRKTKETDIELTLNLDGTGSCSSDTGIGFFDHMLDSFTRHGMFDLELRCKGDLHVDSHHTVEDVGIVLGSAIREALGDKASIRRFGSFYVPMDEALVFCSLDLSGRPFYVSDITYSAQTLGGMETETLNEFFCSVANTAGMNLHFMKLRGENSHHVAEAAFKAFARALDMACGKDERVQGVWSTKDSL